MTAHAHALISLEERFAEGILSGKKLVELRRRPMRLNVGTTVWMYVKVPVGEVIGSARVRALHTLAPQTLWRKFGDVSGLSRAEFFDYFSGVKRGFVLVLDNPVRLNNPVPLERLRILNDGFQPPQFFQHLANDGALVTAFSGNVTAWAPIPPSMTGRQQRCIVAATDRSPTKSSGPVTGFQFIA